ncbi:MAG: hypothetical protein V3S11_07190 [Elusimicrobiota bacterium]
MIESLWIAFSAAALVAVGVWFRKEQKTKEDFFLGGGCLPAWAVCVSFVAAEISVLTVIGVPAVAYNENWHYLQFYIGSVLARIAIAFLLLPAVLKSNSTTIYDFLRRRLGPGASYLSASFFLVMKLLASGVRLMAAAAAISILLDWPFGPTILFVAAVGAVAVGLGGLRAVVWGGVLQAGVLFVAGFAVVDFLLVSIDGGLTEAFHVAGSAGRLDLWVPGALWIAVLHGFFGSVAVYGTDHDMMQRLMSVRTVRSGQRALLWTILGSLVLLVILLTVGTGLFAFYEQHPEMALPADLDSILTHFSIQIMPSWLRGLLAAAVFMAAADLPLASMSAVFVEDFYRPLIRPAAPNRHYVRVGRAAVVVAAILLGLSAWLLGSHPGTLWFAFKIGGVVFGPLLGLFLHSLSTRRGKHPAAAWAAAIAAVGCLYLLWKTEQGVIQLDWSWLVLFGAFGSLGLANLIERGFPKEEA